VPSQDGSAIGIDLAEGDGSHSGALEPEAEAADPAEKVEDIHAMIQAWAWAWADGGFWF
jgi:hypothetical protein